MSFPYSEMDSSRADSSVALPYLPQISSRWKVLIRNVLFKNYWISGSVEKSYSISFFIVYLGWEAISCLYLILYEMCTIKHPITCPPNALKISKVPILYNKMESQQYGNGAIGQLRYCKFCTNLMSFLVASSGRGD